MARKHDPGQTMHTEIKNLALREKTSADGCYRVQCTRLVNGDRTMRHKFEFRLPSWAREQWNTFAFTGNGVVLASYDGGEWFRFKSV